MCHYHLLQALKVVVKLKCNQNKQQQQKKTPQEITQREKKKERRNLTLQGTD